MFRWMKLPERPLQSLGMTLDTTEDAFGRLRNSRDALDDIDTLRARMVEDGYLWLPGLLDLAEVQAARRSVLQELSAEGLLDPRSALDDAIAIPDSGAYFRPDLARDNQPLQTLLYRPDGPMMTFFQAFLGGQVRHFDFTWLRCVAPKAGTPPHADIVYMGRGTTNLYTAWTPLSNIDLEMGGLMVLEDSHKNPALRKGYGTRDVDSYCEDDPNDPARTASGLNGWLSTNPVRLRRGMKARWLTAPFAMGDVLIFNMYLVHGSIDNGSNRFRLSSDARYQLASDPIDERWIGQNPIGHSAAGKRGRIC